MRVASFNDDGRSISKEMTFVVVALAMFEINIAKAEHDVSKAQRHEEGTRCEGKP